MNKYLNTHKSGQAAVILVVVTVMTVLGIAVASSSQTTINLRDTVYSTQTSQALACAEAGVDRAMVYPEIKNETLSDSKTLSSNDGNEYLIAGCDGYTVTLNKYPEVSGDNLVINNIPENVVQEIRLDGFTSNNVTIKFKSMTDGKNVGLAVYRYYLESGEYQVERSMFFCRQEGSPWEPQDTPTDFTELVYNPITSYCETDINISNSGSEFIRIRPIFGNLAFLIPNFEGATGFTITSVGSAGKIERKINVLKFYSQLGEAFDESIVSFDTGD